MCAHVHGHANSQVCALRALAQVHGEILAAAQALIDVERELDEAREREAEERRAVAGAEEACAEKQ